MAQPDRKQLVDNILTDFAVAHFQSASNFVAAQVFPVVQVPKQSAKYNVFSRESFLRSEMRERPNGGLSPVSGWDMSPDSYNCDVFSLAKLVTERDRANWNQTGIDIDESSARYLVQQGLQKMERQFQADYFTTGKWATDKTGVASSPSSSQFIQWDQYATSDPKADVNAGKLAIHNATGRTPNTMVVDYATWLKLQDHPLIIDRVSGGSTSANPALVTRQAVAAVFELERLFVAMGVGATNVEGETLATSGILGKGALLCYASPSPSLDDPSAGYTFMWDAAGSDSPLSVYTIDDPLRGVGTVRHEIEMAWDNKITSTVLGYFLSGTVA